MNGHNLLVKNLLMNYFCMCWTQGKNTRKRFIKFCQKKIMGTKEDLLTEYTETRPKSQFSVLISYIAIPFISIYICGIEFLKLILNSIDRK